nr:PREDICTED: ankyrin repeat and SAM domain-containing protein 4B [Anolis carolinensis]|eukprot:XP_008122633.1 PREDICTED: ankyrin repeat and SAM domain-containing protein 4B [Anolis carolinensis]
MSTRYHHAAADGNLELLKEATRKDLNTSDTDGMTPTLLVAYHGNLDALEIICRRGGDPDKCDIWGNTPLHLAAANGHLHCVSFLITFGANIFALDNDMRSPLDVGRQQTGTCVNVRDAKIKHEHHMNRNFNKGSVSSAGRTGTWSKVSGIFSPGSLSALPKYLSDTFKRRPKKNGENVDKQETGGSRWEKVVGAGRTAVMDVFNEEEEDQLAKELNRKASISDGEEEEQASRSIFNRPGLGNLDFSMGKNADRAFMKKEDVRFKIPNGLLSFEEPEDAEDADVETDPDESWAEEEIGWDDGKVETTPLEVFLAAQSLDEFLPILMRENIDLETLMLCLDEDLRSIQMQLGPRKKILQAISRRKQALESPGKAGDTPL